tara:strand:- start:626 stop:1354 length:729 start_codon:yes stop_codon:yes gene_type:complete
MSSANVAKYDPEYKEQQNATTKPESSDNSKCLTNEDLQKKLNTKDFNKQLSNVISDATGFLNSYIQDQNDIKNNVAEKQSALNKQRLWQTALNKKRSLLDRHTKLMKMLDKEYNTTVQVEQSLTNTQELFKMLTKQNIELKKVIEGEIHSIELSDRKTYYENEQNSWIGWWAHHFKTKYWLLIFLLIMGIILTKRFKETHLWMKVAGLAIYPYIAFLLVSLIFGIWDWIWSDTKWVYLRANM